MLFKTSTLKALIYSFNFIIFLCGAAVLGLGIWSAVQESGLHQLLSGVMLAGVYILIAGGAIVMLLSFLGCYGCGTDSKPAIVVYSTFALIVVILKTIGCIILYNYYIESTEFLGQSYKNDYSKIEKATEAWDLAQINGECCGLNSFNDWGESKYFNETEKYPPSCCVPNDVNPGIALDQERCDRLEKGFIFEDGCGHVLRTYYYAVGGTTVAVIILELITVIFTVWLYQTIP